MFQHFKTETHYRNSSNNGSQANRQHHKRFFEVIRERKTPGRGRRPGALMPNFQMNHLMNDSKSLFSPPPFLAMPNLTPAPPINEFSCIICSQSFIDEFERFKHLSNELSSCHVQFPLMFPTFCLICKKDYQTVSFTFL